MNGNGATLLTPNGSGLNEAQEACIELLSDALEEASKGRISSVAIVVCMDDGLATVMAGHQGAALNIGCDDLKRKIHAAMFEDGNTKSAKKSQILRAGRA